MTEVLRLAPSKDKGKVSAAVTVFKRFATESISTTALAHHLDSLGFRTGYGGSFQSHHVESMLEDPIFIGYYTFNRRHVGKFHRYSDGRVVPEVNYDMRMTKNPRADWVQSRRLFKPLVDRETWDAVQRKLDAQSKRAHAPRSAAQYLAGLVYCGGCGKRMVAGAIRRTKTKPQKDGYLGERHEYRCGTYFKAVRANKLSECKCRRNGVFQDTLEVYIERYLQETGQRLERLTADVDADELTARDEAKLSSLHDDFVSRMMTLLDYIRDHDPSGWDAMWAPIPATQDVPVERAVEFYRRCFDPNQASARLAELEAEHDRLTAQCLNLKTARAIAKVNGQLAALEAEIQELEERRRNVADLVEQQWREVCDLSRAIARARQALASEGGERSMRQRADALRAIIQRIECTFKETGQRGGGWGKKASELATVKIYPVVGELAVFPAEAEGTVIYSNAHSFMYRTRSGRTR